MYIPQGNCNYQLCIFFKITFATQQYLLKLDNLSNESSQHDLYLKLFPRIHSWNLISFCTLDLIMIIVFLCICETHKQLQTHNLGTKNVHNGSTAQKLKDLTAIFPEVISSTWQFYLCPFSLFLYPYFVLLSELKNLPFICQFISLSWFCFYFVVEEAQKVLNIPHETWDEPKMQKFLFLNHMKTLKKSQSFSPE